MQSKKTPPPKCGRGAPNSCFLRKSLVQCLVGEVADTHARFLVVELIHAHVLLLNFDRAIIEWVAAVLTCGDCDHHFGRDDLPVDAPCALGRDSKNFAHNKTF